MPPGRDVREVGGAWAEFQRLWFGVPPPELASYVSRYWFVEWDLRGQPPYQQLIVPYPTVHLSFVSNDDAVPVAMVHGVTRGRTGRELSGRGRVLGVAFRPGAFRPFLRAPVSTLTERSVSAADVFGPSVPGAELAAAPDEFTMVSIVERFLLANLPADDPTSLAVADAVDLIVKDPSITKVDTLAAVLGTTVRQQQRLFAEHVGIGPKRVIRRYRLHEVTQRMAAGVPIDLARLAHDLGYTDQPHLTRDFTAMFGESPTRYAARYAPAG